MIGRKQIKYNTPFLYLTKREGKNIYDLFILIEFLEGTQVLCPLPNQLPQNVDHPEINIRILLPDQSTTTAIDQKFERYTFDFTNESAESLAQKKVIVRTLIDQVGSEAFRQMELFFKDSDEDPTIPEILKSAIDCPYLYLDIHNGKYSNLPSPNGVVPVLDYTSNIVIPTNGGQVLEAECLISTVDGDSIDSLILFEPSKVGEALKMERINQAAVFAEGEEERSFSVLLILLENNNGAGGNTAAIQGIGKQYAFFQYIAGPDSLAKDADKKKKVKTRHGNTVNNNQNNGGQNSNDKDD